MKEILNDIVRLKILKDADGLEKLFTSFNLVELTELHIFSIELKNSCETEIMKQLK